MPRAQVAATRNEYVPEFGRVVRIVEYDRPMLSDDVETAQTVSYMDSLAAADAGDPAVIEATAAALEDAGLDMSASPLAKAQAVYWWLKRTIRYVPTPGTSPLVDQTLITPCAVLAMPEPIGDCPQFSMLACAMFRVLCMESLFVTIKAEREFPDLWSHIYNTVEVFPGQFLPFDSSNGPAPGAEYAQPFAKKVWPRIAPRQCNRSRKETMVRNSYAGRSVPSMRNRVLRRNLGDVQCDSDGNCYDTGGQLVTSPSQTAAGDSAFLMTGAPLTPLQLAQQQASQGDCAYGADFSGGCLPMPAGGMPSPASSPANPSNWLNTLANDVTSLGTSLIRSAQPKPIYITGPNGQQVLYNPATGTIASAATSISPTVIALGLLGIGAFALLNRK